MEKTAAKSKPTVEAGLSQLSSLCQKVLDLAKKHGASEADVSFSADTGLSTSVRLGEVETVEFNRDKGMGVTVYFGKQRGSASCSDTSDSALESAVIAACDIAKVTSGDEHYGLPDRALISNDYPQLDLFHPWAIDAENAIELARICEDVALKTDKRITNSEGATVGSYECLRAYANSAGFAGNFCGTRHSLSCVMIADDGSGMQRNYDYSTARNATHLLSAEAVGKSAAKRTLERLSPKSLSTRKAPVLFSPEVSSSLIGSLISAISGGNLYRQSSFLLDQLGATIFPSRYDIFEAPHLVGALGSAPFDSDGLITRNNHFIKQGELVNYVLSCYSARRLGMQTTANAGGVHNLTVSHDDLDFDALLKKMDTGFLLTELMGQGVNIMTGDYSRGAAGFWVENGEIKYPVDEVTIAGNLKTMYKNIVAIGNDIDKRKSTRCGSILIDEMSISGEG